MPKPLLLVGFLVLGICASAQTLPRTNDMTGAQASKIAARLSPGMLEADVKRLLDQNGLKHFGPWFPVGEYSWSSFYPLRDASALVVGISAPPSASNVWTNGYRFLASGFNSNVLMKLAASNVWTNGHLRVAFLQTNALTTLAGGSTPVLGIIPPASNVWTTRASFLQANSASITMTHTNEP